VFPLPVSESLAVGKIVSDIGKAAGVVVERTEKPDPETGEPTERIKYASAHDLRRSFGTRWAKRVMPAILRTLMRHGSIQTTMAYYVGFDAVDIASDLWANHAPADGNGNGFGNEAGNDGPKSKERGARTDAANAYEQGV